MSMSINAISAVGNSQKTPPAIIAKLQELGIIASGNLQTDMMLLASANSKQGNKVGKAQNAGQLHKAGASTRATLPWADLLNKLGLQPQGSKEADFEAIAQKISSLEASAKTDTEKTNVAGLKAEFQAVGGSTQASEPAQSNASAFAGLNALAQMNMNFHKLKP